MRKIFVILLSLVAVSTAFADKRDSIGSVVDEVIWVVGDEAILKSEVELTRIQAAMEGIHWNGDPDCTIPEQLAVQKLFLHQAAIDSIEVTENEIASQIEQRIDYMIQQTGSREKLEEYKKQSLSQIRQSMHDDLRDQMLIQRMKEKLVKDINVTPAEVRRYFRNLSEDSIPFVPTEVEVQIITQTPRISIEEINRVKDELREYTDRINKGEASFQTLARLYSEDPGSRRSGGELDYTGRGVLDPAFAAVAFNLTDPKKISKIVESEFGFHIIQLIERRGETINCRHILLTAKVPVEALEKAQNQLDSVAQLIRNGDMTFEEACKKFSDDDSKSNGGYLTNAVSGGNWLSLQDLQELEGSYPEYKNLAFVISRLNVGEVSDPLPMTTNENNDAFRLVMVKRKTEAHQANLKDDYSLIQNWALGQKRQEAIGKWVKDKAAKAYIRLDENYKNNDFYYDWNIQ